MRLMARSRPDTWMPWYIGDYLRKTMHLDAEQDGAYRRLIDATWVAGGLLKASDKDLAAIAKLSLKRWNAIKPSIAAFFEITSEGWRHARVSQELATAEEKYNARSEKSRRAAQQRWSAENARKSATFNEEGYASSMIPKCLENTPSPSPSPSPIEEPPSLRSGGSAREARDPPAAEPDDDASRQTPETSKRRRPKPRQRFPADWLPNPQDAAFAHQRGRDDAWIATNALHCRAHHVAKGTLTTDPAATWRTWVLQAPQFERNSTNGGANGHTGPATAHARAAATVLAEREARLGADRPADRALLAPKRRPGDA